MSRVNRAIQQAARNVNEAIGAAYTRREFTVSKFGRHEDGYLHARVIVDGKPYYLHRRHGSWLAPGHINGRAVLKEPEGLLGARLGAEVKFVLADKARTLLRAEHREEDHRDTDTEQPSDAAGDSSPVGDDRVPGTGDSGHAPEPVQAV